MESARDYLIACYLDYRNNYLTVQEYAEHNALTIEQAWQLIDLARDVLIHKIALPSCSLIRK